MSTHAPTLSPLDRRWIKTFAHETRIAILRHMLTVETATPTTLANILRKPVGAVGYHVRQLHEARQIKLVRRVQRRGAIEHHYRLANSEATADAFERMGLEVEEPMRSSPHDALPIASLLGEVEAASVFLERLADRLRIGHVPGEEPIDAIPPWLLANVRRSCQSIARHSIQTLSVIGGRRAAAAAEAAARARDTAERAYKERYQ